MTRYLCCLAVFGVAAVPDWATAYHPCWAPPPCAPAPLYPQQFYLIPHPLPVYEVPLPPPVVQRVPAAAARQPVQATPTPAPAPEPVRPAANTVPTPPVVIPKAPEPKAPEPKAPEPKAPEPKAPLVTPKVPASDVPPLVLPEEPKALPKSSPLILPEMTEPKGPPLVLPPIPSAVPTPAPAPEADPKRGPESIPPLVLPPDLPSGPSGVIPPTTARSSPLAALPRVEVFPAAGAAAGASRRVGFFNHTDRAVRLVIEGRPVTLPAKNYLHAELAPVFRWSEAGGPARTTTVPADAAGVDVLFRGDQ
ncbi:MAG TPA: hypothetical protein VD866_28560 [Urbifossiella sp.]|nr:hypothetical protein [Urbifossiella sp.]